jgi:hypothetical protein
MAKVYWIDKDALAVADINAVGDLSGPTSGVLTLHCSRHDSPFVNAETGNVASGVRVETGMTESPVIPVEFHESIVHLAVAHGYEKKGDLKQAGYFLAKFERAMAIGSKEANSHKSEESSIVIPGTDF